jgi:DNA-binding response OmpR family regulator
MPNLKVLVVEDEFLIASSLILALSNAGYEVLGPLSSGEEAISSPKGKEADIAIIDINLKGKIDGIRVAASMRRGKIPAIIFMTGYADEVLRTEAFALHPIAYLVKPVKANKIINIIQEYRG